MKTCRIGRCLFAMGVVVAVDCRHSRHGATRCLSIPNNYAQNLLTAAHTLQQINNQITALQNQTQMLINQAKNLANLPTSILQQLQSNHAADPDSCSPRPRASAFDIGRIQQAFSTTYGAQPANSSNAALDRRPPRRAGRFRSAAFQDSLRIRPASSAISAPTPPRCRRSVTSSQSASGALQAAQAGNQLLALQSQQISDLVAVARREGRADALEQARTVTNEAQGQAQYQLFATRSGYVPGNVTMFTGN